MSMDAPRSSGVAGRIARAFIDSKLTPLIIIAAVLLGIAAIVLLPREEEPQIKVPMVDVMVNMAGFSAKEVEERATRPMEKLLWEIPGVEYIYSTSRDSESLVIVRFKVGSDPEECLVRLTEKLRSNFDRIPHGVGLPLIKPKSIDDVPILALTFHSARYDHLTLRRLVAEVDDAVKAVPLVAETTIIGGARREVRVLARSGAARLAQSQRRRPRADAPAGEPAISLRRPNDQRPGVRDRNRRVSDQRGGRRQCGRRRLRRAAGLSARSRRNRGRRGGTVELHLLRPRCGPRLGARRRTRRHAQHREAARRERDRRRRRRAAQGRRRSRARSSRAMSKSRSRATTARPPRKNPTNCCCTWASPSSACRFSSGSRSAGANRASSRSPSRPRSRSRCSFSIFSASR